MIQKKNKAKGISFLLKIEFGAEFTDAKIIAITGSNGKTTINFSFYPYFKNDNMNVGLGGNIGKKFCFASCQRKLRILYVLEVSSFQLDDIQEF